ncbi:MAG TPA: DegT/DnrJ/EryC1/StrS aminotransferase family protein [Mycobacteriales bacterium]|nr:DegT/DnrJ/EryC1/StrS aminotransferase family protein [Mycobacteriales bacterium]
MKVPAARIVFAEADRREVADAVVEMLESGALTLGAHTMEFERAFAVAHAAPHAVAVSSGTAALEIILRSVGVADRPVVVPANTFYATAGAVLHAGARPVFADVDADTLALSPATLENVLSEDTAAVVLVHVGGLISPDADAIRAICAARGVALVEDAAHAHGSTMDGRFAGSFGVAAAFSFYPTKVVTTGEGGLILTHDAALRDEALVYRDQGKAGFLGNVHIRLGHAWRMSELHAAVGAVHLRRLEEFVAHRGRVARRYDAGVAGSAIDGLRSLPIPDRCRSNYYKYIVLLPGDIDRTELKKRLREHHDITLSGEVYELPLHRQPVFEGYGGEFPVAEDVCARQVCLPLHSDMTEQEADYVLDHFLVEVADMAGRGAP